MDFWVGKKVLVTGHTGFKGSWLCLWLSMLGAEVCGYALEPETKPNLFEDLSLRKSVQSVIGNICDLEKLKGTVRKFEPQIVFHLAAQSLVRRSYREPHQTYQTNFIGTLNVLEAIRGESSVKAVVIVTTDKVYENKEWLWAYRENERLGGFDPYSNSKACAELAVSAYRHSFFADNETLIATARAGNVIGGGDWAEDRLLPDVFRSLIFGNELIVRYPQSIRPWQFVLEPLFGYMLLAEKLFKGERAFGEAWNFGPSEGFCTVRQVLEEVEKFWHDKINWRIDNSNSVHEAKVLSLDSSKAKSRLNWSSKLTLSESLRLTTEWYESYYNQSDVFSLTEKQIKIYQQLL